MGDEGARLLEVALLAADTGAQVAMAWRQKADQLRVEEKAGPADLVSQADREVEDAIRAVLARERPHDGVLGEERGGTSAGSSGIRWIVDPIDGTKTFMRGVPLWGTLVACVEGEGDDATVLAGAAYFPAVGELVAAAPGEGCWWNGARARVSEEGALDRALVCTTDPKFSHRPERRAGWRRVEDAALLSRSWADCYGYLLVATGRAEAMVDAITGDWDSAALLPIVEEAGGVFTSWEGVRTGLGGSAVATNRALAGEVRRLLGG